MEQEFCKRIFFKDKRTPILALILDTKEPFLHIETDRERESYPLSDIHKIQETDIPFISKRCQ